MSAGKKSTAGSGSDLRNNETSSLRIFGSRPKGVLIRIPLDFSAISGVIICLMMVLDTEAVVVQTKQGPLRGLSSDRVASFLGVPYAAPPVGALRFMPPAAPQPWNSPTRSFVRPATSPAPACPQSLPDLRDEKRALMYMSRGRLEHLKSILPLLRNQSEDCLYLNVFTPTKELGASRLGVVVLLHVGDSFEWGSSALLIDGRVLASQGNVVVVTLNFRLGILGFLRTDGAANFGLLDQIGALLWVKENIANFGGDADNVSVLGHGHGAVMAHLLAASPIASALFRRLVLMSGNAFVPDALVHDPDHVAREISRQLDCAAENTASCLRHKSVDELIEINVGRRQRGLFRATFGPVVDGVVVAAHPGKNPSKFALENHEVMTGITSSEALLIFNQALLDRGVEAEGKREMLAALAASALDAAGITANMDTVVNALDQTYAHDNDEDNRNNDDNMRNALSVVRAFGDVKVVRPVLMGAGLKARRGRSPVFVYVFEHDLKDDAFPDIFGSVHGQELAFFIGMPLHADYRERYSEQDQRVANIALNYLLDFVDKGSGGMSFRRASQTLPRWPSFESRQQSYLALSAEVRVRSHYRQSTMLTWDKLISARPRKHVVSHFEDNQNNRHPIKDAENDFQIRDKMSTNVNNEDSYETSKKKNDFEANTFNKKNELAARPGSSLADRKDEKTLNFLGNLVSARLVAAAVLVLLLLNVCLVALCITVHRIRAKMRRMPPSRIQGANNEANNKIMSRFNDDGRRMSASATQRLSQHVRFGPDTMMMESSNALPMSDTLPNLMADALMAPSTSSSLMAPSTSSSLMAPSTSSSLMTSSRMRKLSLPSYARSLSSRSSSPPPTPIIEMIPVDEYARLHPDFVVAENTVADPNFAMGSRRCSDNFHLSSFACPVQSPCSLCDSRLFANYDHNSNDNEAKL